MRSSKCDRQNWARSPGIIRKPPRAPGTRRCRAVKRLSTMAVRHSERQATARLRCIHVSELQLSPASGRVQFASARLAARSVKTRSKRFTPNRDTDGGYDVEACCSGPHCSERDCRPRVRSDGVGARQAGRYRPGHLREGRCPDEVGEARQEEQASRDEGARQAWQVRPGACRQDGRPDGQDRRARCSAHRHARLARVRAEA